MVRKAVQPWIEDEIFCPLRDRGIEIVHVDMRESPGVDIQVDLTDAADVRRLGSGSIKGVAVLQPAGARPCARRGWRGIVSNFCRQAASSLSRCRSAIPITAIRSTRCTGRAPPNSRKLFADARLLDGMILGAGMSYRDAVRQRPWILLRHIAGFPCRFCPSKNGSARWRGSTGSRPSTASPAPYSKNYRTAVPIERFAVCARLIA